MPRVAVALVIVGAGHVDGVPVRRKPTGHAGADTQKALRARAGAEAYHDLLWNRGLLKALGPAIVSGTLAHLLGCRAQDSSRSMFRLPLRKKLASECSTFSGA